MIVVSVIGLMALIAIPTWVAAKNRANTTVCQRNQAMVFEQMNIYCLERNKLCDTTTFPDLPTVRGLLMPDDPNARYIKRGRPFACPANSESVDTDYRFIRDGYKITGVECDFTDDHND